MADFHRRGARLQAVARRPLRDMGGNDSGDDENGADQGNRHDLEMGCAISGNQGVVHDITQGCRPERSRRMRNRLAGVAPIYEPAAPLEPALTQG